MSSLILVSSEGFSQMVSETVSIRLLMKLNKTLSTGTRFLGYTVVEQGRECFTWNIVDPEIVGSGYSYVSWVPSVEHPLDVARRDDILSGVGACALIPAVLNAMQSRDGVIDIDGRTVKVSSPGLGIVEMR